MKQKNVLFTTPLENFQRATLIEETVLAYYLKTHPQDDEPPKQNTVVLKVVGIIFAVGVSALAFLILTGQIK